MRTKVPMANLTKHKKFMQRQIILFIQRFVLHILAIEIDPNKSSDNIRADQTRWWGQKCPRLTKHKKFLQKQIVLVIQRFVLHIIAIEISPNKIEIISGLTKPDDEDKSTHGQAYETQEIPAETNHTRNSQVCIIHNSYWNKPK